MILNFAAFLPPIARRKNCGRERRLNFCELTGSAGAAHNPRLARTTKVCQQRRQIGEVDIPVAVQVTLSVSRAARHTEM